MALDGEPQDRHGVLFTLSLNIRGMDGLAAPSHLFKHSVPRVDGCRLPWRLSVEASSRELRQHGILMSTDQVPGDLHNEFWREFSRPLLEVSPPSGDPTAILEGSISSHAVGSLLLGVTTFNRQRYKRDRHTITQSGLDHAFREIVRSGRHGSSLTELAYRLGFSSSGQFSRAFRSHYGISPSDAGDGIQPIPFVRDRRAELNSHFARYAARRG